MKPEWVALGFAVVAIVAAVVAVAVDEVRWMRSNHALSQRREMWRLEMEREYDAGKEHYE